MEAESVWESHSGIIRFEEVLSASGRLKAKCGPLAAFRF